MPASTRSARIRTLTAAAAGAAAVLSLTAACAVTTATTNPAGSGGLSDHGGQRTAAVNPGLTGNAITLTTNAEFSGYDAATDSSGTTYVGWIGDTGSLRKVDLCVLPRGAQSCKGGVQQIDPPDGDSSADGLRVLVTGPQSVTLVWFHNADASETGPQGSEISTATVQGGILSAGRDVATAPSFGTMLDAVIGPDGTIWVVTRGGGNAVQVRPGLANPPVTLKTPYLIGYALLRFAGTEPVLVIDKDGAISSPVSFASQHSGSWSAFGAVAGTWTGTANFGLATTRSGVRLIATTNSASYQPVVSTWTGSAFGVRTLTGDHNSCAPGSHDAVSDASGRLADVSVECDDIAVANLADTLHAAIFRYDVHGTFAGGQPQLTTSPNGTGWVAWSIESAHGDELLVAPLRLAGR